MAKKSLRVFRLALIQQADFRKSAETQFKALQKQRRELLTNNGKDAIVLFSKTGGQVRFILDYRTVPNLRGGTTTAFAFEQINLGKGKWDRARIGDYAKMRGIKFEGIYPLDEIWARFDRAMKRALQEHLAKTDLPVRKVEMARR